MRPLCPGPDDLSGQALDHTLVAPEVLALQPRLLAPVDLLNHLPDLVLGDLLLHPRDAEKSPPPPDDGWDQGLKTFLVSSECFSNLNGQRIANYGVSGAIPSSNFGRHPALALSLIQPEAAVWGDVEPVLQQTDHSQADVKCQDWTRPQTFSSLASIKTCLVTPSPDYHFILYRIPIPEAERLCLLRLFTPI